MIVVPRTVVLVGMVETVLTEECSESPSPTGISKTQGEEGWVPA